MRTTSLLSRVAALLLVWATAVRAQQPAQPKKEEPQKQAQAAPEKKDEAQKQTEDAQQPQKDDEPKLNSVPGGKALGMSILGNQEAPKALVIVPWKSSELGNGPSAALMLDEAFGHLPRSAT